MTYNIIDYSLTLDKDALEAFGKLMNSSPAFIDIGMDVKEDGAGGAYGLFEYQSEGLSQGSLDMLKSFMRSHAQQNAWVVVEPNEEPGFYLKLERVAGEVDEKGVYLNEIFEHEEAHHQLRMLAASLGVERWHGMAADELGQAVRAAVNTFAPVTLPDGTFAAPGWRTVDYMNVPVAGTDEIRSMPHCLMRDAGAGRFRLENRPGRGWELTITPHGAEEPVYRAALPVEDAPLAVKVADAMAADVAERGLGRFMTSGGRLGAAVAAAGACPPPREERPSSPAADVRSAQAPKQDGRPKAPVPIPARQ